MSQDSAPIIIDLFQPDFSYAGSLLQRDALSSLETFVTERIKELERLGVSEEETSDIFYHRFHRAVLIEGGRGSGKTTFLLKALKEMKSGKGAHLCILQMIDPTLIETKDHIILVILQMIDAAVDAATNHGHMHEELNQTREALADGLALLDGIGPKESFGNEWEDSSWVMSEGLRKAKKGRLFEQKFNAFIECALKALKKKAFVLAFDDVDTSFKRGHMILETIRKYLTSPHLFLILSGDLDLYGRLVRKDIYATFGSDVMNHDRVIIPDGKNSISNATLELEEQYLLKVLPPQYRIPMLPLGALKDPVEVRPTENAESKNLEVWVSEKIRIQLREKENGQRHPFLNVIFAEHLRLVLGYMRALQNADGNSTVSRRKVLQVFDARLRAAGVTELFLQRGMFNRTLRTVFEWFCERDEPSALIMFRNQETSEEAVALHCLSLALSDGLKDGSAVLRALFTLALPAAMTKQGQLNGPTNHKKVLEFLWWPGKASLLDVAARITSISRGSDMRGRLRASVFGSVGLAQNGSFSSQQPAIVRIYGIPVPKDARALTFDELKEQSISAWKGQDNINSNWLEILENTGHKDLIPIQNVSWFTIDKLLEENRCGIFGSLLDLISFRHFNSSNETQYSISALSIFAAIGELLAEKTVKDEDLVKLSLGDIIPNFGQAGSQKTDDETSEESTEDEDDDTPDRVEGNQGIDSTQLENASYGDFLDALSDWLAFAHELNETTALSPSLLGALANRLHDDLLDLDDAWRVGKVIMTGQILHRQITSILNAVVTVTAELSGRKESPKSSDAPFGRALKRTQTEMLHPLSVVLLSCPLVWAFLNPKGTFEQSATSSENLRDTICETLKAWHDAFPEKKHLNIVPNFEKWTTAPKVTVKIGRVRGNSITQRTVVTDGFFDLLNVVPRYSKASQGKK